ncbi:hypothetical protein REPUB_Repub14bG0067200 [Reevesia pubescens]
MNILRHTGGLNARAAGLNASFSRALTLEEKLRSKMTRSENDGRFWIAFAESISAETRNALLVVCGLILAATYQTTLSPPPACASQPQFGLTSNEGTLIKGPSKVDNSVTDQRKWEITIRPRRSEGFGSSSSSSKGLKMRHVAASEASDSSFMVDDLLAAAMAAVVRAKSKDFQSCEAIMGVQTAFRGSLVYWVSHSLLYT